MKARVPIVVAVLIVGIGAGFALGVLAAPALQHPGPVPAGTAGQAAPPSPAPAAAPSLPPVPKGLSEDEVRTIEVFRNASSSVVFITTVAYRRDFFTMNVTKVPQGTGSGFVWDRNGHIVTNFHVIEGGREFIVTLADQSGWEAEVVGVAPEKDLAVLRIQAPAGKLTPLTVGRSRNLVVGQKVLAIGNPFGLDLTLTTGVVSALNRELQAEEGRTIRDVIQTDAAINPGNSGGPLLDSGGNLIGVNAAIYSPSGASAGIGFAVPVDTVKRIVPQLIRYGKTIQPGIGIQPYTSARFAGVVVVRVSPGSPAAAAGLQGVQMDHRGRTEVGDVIVAVDGKPVRNLEDMMDAFEAVGVGHEATLTVENHGESRKVGVKLAEVG